MNKRDINGSVEWSEAHHNMVRANIKKHYDKQTPLQKLLNVIRANKSKVHHGLDNCYKPKLSTIGLIEERNGIASFTMYPSSKESHIVIEYWTPSMKRMKRKVSHIGSAVPYVKEYYAKFKAYTPNDGPQKPVHIRLKPRSECPSIVGEIDCFPVGKVLQLKALEESDLARVIEAIPHGKIILNNLGISLKGKDASDVAKELSEAISKGKHLGITDCHTFKEGGLLDRVDFPPYKEVVLPHEEHVICNLPIDSKFEESKIVDEDSEFGEIGDIAQLPLLEETDDEPLESDYSIYEELAKATHRLLEIVDVNIKRQVDAERRGTPPISVGHGSHIRTEVNHPMSHIPSEFPLGGIIQGPMNGFTGIGHHYEKENIELTPRILIVGEGGKRLALSKAMELAKMHTEGIVTVPVYKNRKDNGKHPSFLLDLNKKVIQKNEEQAKILGFLDIDETDSNGKMVDSDFYNESKED